jgi:cytochrome c2
MARDGLQIFEDVCMKCHTPITQKTGWYDYLPADGSKEMLAVVTPRGPTLNGIVGRPAGIISNYKYSKGMLKFSASGAIWDRETLDQFLTDSRKFVKGTFMIVKLPADDRRLVLDYLESVATYQP